MARNLSAIRKLKEKYKIKEEPISTLNNIAGGQTRNEGQNYVVVTDITLKTSCLSMNYSMAHDRYLM